MYVLIFLSLSLQGRDRSPGWTKSRAKETAKCIPVPRVVEASVSRTKDAVLLQARECKYTRSTVAFT